MIDLIGHDNQIENLLKNYKSDNLHSSVIIYGPKGIGKRTLINNFILKILKDKTENKNYSHHINLFNNNTHPNIYLLEKELDKKNKKLKSNITIDQVRSLKQFMYESESINELNKLIIIDSADDLNINSSNSLLKTLEEPSKKTFLFLISHQISSLLPTIRSRCLKIKLDKLNYENFNKILKNNITNLKNEDSKFLYDLTLGSVGDTISIFQNNIIDIFDMTIKSFINNDLNNNLELANSISKFDNDQFKIYLSILKSILNILNNLKNNSSDQNLYLSDKINVLKDISNALTTKNILDRFEFLSKNESDLFTYNLDKKLFIMKFLTYHN